MEVGLLHHLGFKTEAESLCEAPRCLWAWGSPVCALQLGAAARFAVSPRLHACVDWGKAGGAPRGAAGNSFLPPQNREELLIPSTGEVCGHVFYDQGAAAVPAACRQRLPQAGGVALCQGLFKELPVEGSPVGWGADSGMATAGCCSPKSSQDQHYWCKGSPSLVAGLCCPARSFYPGFDVCHTGWSLFICLLCFPCCVSLRSVPMLSRSHSLMLALPCFLPSFPVSPFSYQGCFSPVLCEITSLLPAAGLDLRCATGSILAASSS